MDCYQGTGVQIISMQDEHQEGKLWALWKETLEMQHRPLAAQARPRLEELERPPGVL